MDENAIASERVEGEHCPGFTFSPQSPKTGETVQFKVNPSYHPGVGVYDEEDMRYHWYFDGGKSPDDTGVTVTKSFDEIGNHTVSLSVFDRGSANYVLTQYERTVEVVNTPPTAEFVYSPESPMIDQKIEFDASGSFDREKELENYTWNLGDGTTAAGVKINRKYDEYGEYDVTLTVNDGDMTDRETETIVIENIPPVPKINFDRLPDELTVDDSIRVNASKSYDTDRGIRSYTWEFGDGTTKEGEVVNHTFPTPGEFNLTLTVDDGFDKTKKVKKIDVVNRPPVANFTYSTQKDLTTEDSIIFNASGSHDPDENIKEIRWRFGDGETTTGKVVEHSYDELGTYEVTVGVYDGFETVEKKSTLTIGPGEEGENLKGLDTVAAIIALLLSFFIIRKTRYAFFE